MVFEDIHWADAALLEFVEALLERSRSHPIFVLTLARPDLLERHPGWGSRVRSFTSVTLDPLDDDAIDALLRGLVPGSTTTRSARSASARRACRSTRSRPCGCCSTAGCSSPARRAIA